MIIIIFVIINNIDTIIVIKLLSPEYCDRYGFSEKDS